VRAASWGPEIGDRLVVDTQENKGFLIHPDGRYIRFDLITGQKRNVYYIGRYYNAATPNYDWVIKSKHIKGDRITYGSTGRFLRLYKNDEFTHYGIHEHRDEQIMFERNDRFQSMGCIIVRSNMLDIIEETYELNKNNLPVTTRHGVDNPVEVAFSG